MAFLKVAAQQLAVKLVIVLYPYGYRCIRRNRSDRKWPEIGLWISSHRKSIETHILVSLCQTRAVRTMSKDYEGHQKIPVTYLIKRRFDAYSVPPPGNWSTCPILDSSRRAIKLFQQTYPESLLKTTCASRTKMSLFDAGPSDVQRCATIPQLISRIFDLCRWDARIH